MSDPFSTPPPPPPPKNYGGMVKVPGTSYRGGPKMEAPKIATTETRVIRSLPPSVQHALAQMDVQSQNAFFFEYQAKQKSVVVARLLSFLLGWHYIYLRKTGMQFLYWASWFFGFWPGFIWWIVDIVRMGTKVAVANELVAREILQSLAFGNQFKNSEPPA